MIRWKNAVCTQRERAVQSITSSSYVERPFDVIYNNGSCFRLLLLLTGSILYTHQRPSVCCAVFYGRKKRGDKVTDPEPTRSLAVENLLYHNMMMTQSPQRNLAIL